MAESSEQGPFVRALLPRPLTAQIHGGSESTDLSQQLRPRLVLLEHSLAVPAESDPTVGAASLQPPQFDSAREPDLAVVEDKSPGVADPWMPRSPDRRGGMGGEVDDNLGPDSSQSEAFIRLDRCAPSLPTRSWVAVPTRTS